MRSCDVEDLEPLLPEIWISRVERIAGSLRHDRLDLLNLARLLRLACHICRLAPRSLQIEGLNRNRADCLEALLEAEQLDGAAALLLSSEPELEIQQSDMGTKASVRLFRGGAMGKALGSTTPQALLAAILDCLMIEHELNQAIRTYPLSDDSLRRSQSGSHP